MNLRSVITLSLLLLTLVACGRPEPSPTDGSATDGPTNTPSPEPPVGESPLSFPATSTPAPPERTSPLPDPTTSPIETPAPEVDQVMEAAREHLARELQVPLEDVEPLSIQRTEWPDASLGCPKPGEAYAQVITPGYKVVLEVDGAQYELHTDQTGGAIRLCEDSLDEGPAAAVAYLADELQIPRDEVELVSVQRAEWPDASLGCPEPGRSYAQVVTPGYRVTLSARGEQFEVHADRQGQIVVICEP